jgi:hypothetical protein
MTTIVSAFISNVNFREDVNFDKYCQLGKLLLKSTTQKIIFLDDIMYNYIKNEDFNKENTLIIKYNKDECYLYNYLDKLHKFNLHTDNPKKDTLEYILIMCNKTEWIRQAIENDIFNSKNFIWIDFGIRKLFDCSDDIFIEILNNLYFKTYEKIRIGSIWDLSIKRNYIDTSKQIIWYFAGSVFGGDKKSLLNFADRMKDKCIEIIINHNTIMWEVNIWYFLYLDYPELFEPYQCDHNNTILNNY